MAESAESTAGAPAEESQTPSQSTNDPPKTDNTQVTSDNKQVTADNDQVTPSKGMSFENVAVVVLGFVAIAAILVYINRRMARDSANAMWEAEEEYNGKRLFGEHWRDMN